MDPSASQHTPPGWYHDGREMRWWDGNAWGPSAPTQQTGGTDKMLPVLVHLGAFFGGFILPLIVYLIERDKNEFTRHHAAEALNFQITVGIVSIGTWLVSFLGIVGAVGFGNSDAPPGPFFVGFALMFVAMFASWGLGILGALKAGRGEWWRYPVAFRFVDRGRRPA